MAAAGERVTDIERRWAQAFGPQEFAGMCQTMQTLLDLLTSDE